MKKYKCMSTLKILKGSFQLSLQTQQDLNQTSISQKNSHNLKFEVGNLLYKNLHCMRIDTEVSQDLEI